MSDDELDIPPASECQRRIDKFVAVASTDEALAQMRLQNNGWDLDRALEEHFGQLEPKVTPQEPKMAAPPVSKKIRLTQFRFLFSFEFNRWKPMARM